MITDEDWQQPYPETSFSCGASHTSPPGVSITRTRSNTNDAVQAHLGLDEVSRLLAIIARRRLSASVARPKRSAGDTTGATLSPFSQRAGDQPAPWTTDCLEIVSRELGKRARPSLTGSRGRSGMRLMAETSWSLQPFVSS